jgi:hypothetical protein
LFECLRHLGLDGQASNDHGLHTRADVLGSDRRHDR